MQFHKESRASKVKLDHRESKASKVLKAHKAQ